MFYFYTPRALRTTDSTPPVITSLTTTWTPPMRLLLAVNASKPGALRFLARRPAQPAPTGAAALLDAVAANNLAAANFTGSVVIPAGGYATAVMCVADGDAFVVDAVAQDREGDFAGRWPNNSTMTRWGPHTLLPSVASAAGPAST